MREVTDFKTVYHKPECFCGHLMSDCIFSEILVYLWRRKVWQRISGEQQTAKICTACQSLEKKKTGKEKNVKKETANEACFNKGIDGDAGKDVVWIDDKCPQANTGGKGIGKDAHVCWGKVERVTHRRLQRYSCVLLVFWMPWLFQRLTNNVSNEEENTGKEMRGQIGEANSTRP